MNSELASDPSGAWYLKLLGQPSLKNAHQEIPVSANTMAVLAYLALEGTTPKYQLAGWLWPDTNEESARANMRKLLQRLRKQTSSDLVLGEDQLSLALNVEVDVVRLEALSLKNELEQQMNPQPLLTGLEFDHAPDFEEWLFAARERVDGLRRRVLVARLEYLEHHGQFAEALELARWAVSLDPLSEEAHRRVMRFAYLMGDRNAAIQAYQRCREVLWHELQMAPLPETVQLAVAIESGSVPVPESVNLKPSVPLNILRPPMLVGREREWAQLEDAWERGQFITIAGDPGAGKTRLMIDFVTSNVPSEHILYLQSRPGDAAVPYSTHARNFRKMLDQFKPDLEPWVLHELARIIPELGDAPAPIASESEKLRFYQAKSEAMRGAARKGMQVLVSDDVQFTDLASTEAAIYMMSSMNFDSPVRAVHCYRRDEVDERIAAGIKGLVHAGLAVLVEPEPLDVAAINALLSSLDLPGAETLSAAVSRFTGGNPLFLLETLKNLVETGELHEGWAGTMPPPGKVGPIIQRRLERLSPPALQAARAAAVLQSDFNLELISQVLNAPLLDLMQAWEELEAAQVVSGERFSHDLVYETVAASIPGSVRGLLHRCAARSLAQNDANPALVARHWLEGGKQDLAIPHLKRAAQSAQSLGLEREATQAWQQLLEIAQTDVDRLEAHHSLAKMAAFGSPGMA